MNKDLIYQMKLNAIAMQTISKLATGLALLGGQNIVDQVMAEHQIDMNVLSVAAALELLDEE